MYPSRSLALIGLALAAPAASFTAVSPSRATSRPSLPILRATEDGSERSTTTESIRALVAASAIGVGLLFPAAGALAVQDTAALQHMSPNEHMMQSSLTLSVEIKTMDFALPSSYDSIADPVASGTEELTKTVNVVTGKTTKKKEAAPKKEKKQPVDQAERKEASAAALAERVAQRKAKEAEDAATEAERAAEVQERIKQARLEKIAAREAAKEEKAAAEAAAADEARLKGAKFVDTAMPSY
ncbi:hypothetical protein ACHAXT_002377 [Thalassiosira profunda]